MPEQQNPAEMSKRGYHKSSCGGDDPCTCAESRPPQRNPAYHRYRWSVVFDADDARDAEEQTEKALRSFHSVYGETLEPDERVDE